jgi:4-amino-4-deoxy-L-arabinose transferase-like glycosyltransferase
MSKAMLAAGGAESAVSPSSQTAWTRLAILGVLLAAFALRCYHLDFQSFWSDEGISLNRASLALGEMLATMPVEHMPGYFVALHGWRLLIGDHDFGLRFLSLVPSVLAVALVYRLAVDLDKSWPVRWRVGVIAAALMATSWFQVWYAQEARMYSWLLACALLASWALWRLLYAERRRLIFAALYTLAITLGVYLHFYGFLLPIAHTVFVMGWLLVTHRWRVGLAWLGASMASVVLFLPWLPRALGIFGFGGWRESGNPQEIPWRYLAAYTAGDAMPAPLGGWLPWFSLALAVVGTIIWWRQRTSAGLFLLTSCLVPLGVIYLLAVRNPDFHERYAIAITGSLTILVASGVAGLDVNIWRSRNSEQWAVNSGQWVGAMPTLIVVALLLAANLAALQRQSSDATLHKPDFRAAAQRIQQQQQPADVILVDGPNPELVFNHYYRGGLPVHDLRTLEGAEGDRIEQTLAEATEDAGRAWEVLFFHEPAGVQVWLATRAFASEPTYHNGIRLTLYGLPVQPELVSEPNVQFGSALTLIGAEINRRTLSAGDLLQVATDWQVSEQAPELKFSLRLLDAAGNVALSQDYTPQNWFAPTNVWLVGQPARDQHALLIPTGFPPGDYTLSLRLYDPATGTAVETIAGQDVALGQVEVRQ